jgi:hypothetical protein
MLRLYKEKNEDSEVTSPIPGRERTGLKTGHYNCASALHAAVNGCREIGMLVS